MNLPTRSVATLATLRLSPKRLEPTTKVHPKQLRLTIDAQAAFNTGDQRKIRILIDTGAEVNLLKRGIAYPECIQPARNPIQIAAANKMALVGGDKEVSCILTFLGTEIDEGGERILEVPTTFYEADIGIDAILSYEWLATYDFLVNPRRHGIGHKVYETGEFVWVPGNKRSAEVASASASPSRVETPTVVAKSNGKPAKRPVGVPRPPHPPPPPAGCLIYFPARGRWAMFSAKWDMRSYPWISTQNTTPPWLLILVRGNIGGYLGPYILM